MNLIAKSYMALAGVTGRQIARKARVTETWVSLVLNNEQRSDRIRQAIVDEINRKLKKAKKSSKVLWHQGIPDKITVSDLWAA